MNSFQLERFPDAMRTLSRLSICFVPVLVFVIILRWDLNFGYDPDHFQELIRFQNRLTAAIAVMVLSIAVVVFAQWQFEARSLITDEGGLGWLAIHGWEGELDKLPQRGLVPISELLGILVVAGLVGRMMPIAIVALPMIWSIVRLVNCRKWTAGERPYVFGAICILHASAIRWLETRWLAIAIELVAIVLTEFLMRHALRRVAHTTMTGNLTLATKRSRLVPANSLETQRRVSAYDAPVRLYPFWELRPVIDSESPSLPRSIWTATVVAWVMFCITSRAAELGSFQNRVGEEHSLTELLGTFGVLAVTVIGLLRTLMRFDPFVWNPRLDPLARCRLFSPIVWSWDWAFVPVLLDVAQASLAATFRTSMSPIAFAAVVFAQVVIMHRDWWTPEDWQMTSDARLAKRTISRHDSSAALQN